MSTFADYVTANRKGKVKADAVERWESRVLPRGLNAMGMDGARQYLSDYGKGIAAPKCTQLALKAEAEGCYEMAAGFWAKAYQLETGVEADTAEYPSPNGAVVSVPVKTPAKKPVEAKPSVFPRHLQPGKVITMQPVDAPRDRQYYIDSNDYLGQPKKDGTRMLAFVENGQVAYQTRSMRLRETPSVELDQALMAAAEEAHAKAFVLDGEAVYLDWRGGEHRTGAQAAQVNIDEGYADVQPVFVYYVFEALHFGGIDLTAHTKKDRIAAAMKFHLACRAANVKMDVIGIVPTAYTREQKQRLVEQQLEEGREGEVWTHVNASYTDGKSKGREFPTVRTKYLNEWDLIVTGLTPSTAEGRPFGAIEVARKEKGKLIPMGSVGTGFTVGEMEDLARRYAAAQECGAALTIKVISQGLTENGLLWHARYDGFSEE